MRMRWLILCSALLVAATLSAVGQSLDAAVSLGSVATSDFSGGVWPGLSVTGMFSSHFGANAEFAARGGSSNPTAYLPAFRQYLLDFNGVYRPLAPDARFQPELLVGGGTSIEHTSEVFGCPGPCVPPPSTLTQGALHLGGGLTAYATAHMFVRFTANFYYTHNLETPLLFAVSLGYTFGGHR